MAMPDPAALLPLAESVADGSAVDWDAAEARAIGDQRGVIRQLRILANLGGLHRSLPADPRDLPPASVARRANRAPAIGSWAHLALVERLGGGAFGDVYRAWDRHLEREVALKLLRVEESTDDPQASRIAMEGRLLARVRHSNVIAVHGVAVHEQRVGLWMELIRGATLEQLLLKQGPFSAREASLIGIDLCRALAAIHAAGLVHRDVKAQNVMREDGGRLVLMDLGTGREIDPRRHHALPDLAGTPLYLAPEIFGGASASERSDLYSLGVLLYHLVTGSFPVRATTIEELQEGHAKAAGVRLRDARADLPTAFVRVVDRATTSDPDRRYASAGVLEADLVEALDDTATPTAASAPTATPRTWPASWRRTGILAASLVVLLGLGALLWPALRGRPVPGGLPGPIRSIAVLPLANLSGDPAQEYFADGMTDELIGTLGRLGGVNVISRTSAMQFKDSRKPLPEIARALHVDAVLEGSVLVTPGAGPQEQNGAQRVRINARLIDAGADTQLWDRTFERVVADVLALQREVARAVTDGIQVRLTSEQQQFLGQAGGQNAAAQDFEAFNLYLKGRYDWNTRTEEGLNRSVQYFQAAIDRDPRFALGYTGLADAYNVLATYGFVPRTEGLRRSSVAASKALELDDSLAEAHAALAFVHNQRLEWDAAKVDFTRALSLKPGYAAGHHWYANYLLQLGRFPEATAEINRALALDPLSIGVNGALGSILLVVRRYDAAIGQLEKTLQMDPAFTRARMVLAEAFAHKGEYQRALAEITRAAALAGGGGPELRADIGYIEAVSGRRAEALRIVEDLTNRYRRNEDGAAGGLTVVYAGLRETDRAFEWLERARVLADPVLPDLKTDPRFDNLRADPRFGKFLASVGFTQ